MNLEFMLTLEIIGNPTTITISAFVGLTVYKHSYRGPLMLFFSSTRTGFPA